MEGALRHVGRRNDPRPVVLHNDDAARNVSPPEEPALDFAASPGSRPTAGATGGGDSNFTAPGNLGVIFESGNLARCHELCPWGVRGAHRPNTIGVKRVLYPRGVDHLGVVTALATIARVVGDVSSSKARSEHRRTATAFEIVDRLLNPIVLVLTPRGRVSQLDRRALGVTPGADDRGPINRLAVRVGSLERDSEMLHGFSAPVLKLA